MTTLAMPMTREETAVPSIVWAFVQRVVEQGTPGEVYTYIHRGVEGTTEYVLTPIAKPLPPGAEARERSIVLAARPKTPSAACTFRTLAFRRENGVWVKTAR